VTIVKFEDIRVLDYCWPGTRAWFEHHGLDYRQFVRSGIPAEQILATGDAMAARVVEAAKRREANE